MYNNNIRTDSEIHKFINSEFRNDRLRLEWPLVGQCIVFIFTRYIFSYLFKIIPLRINVWCIMHKIDNTVCPSATSRALGSSR